MSQVGGPVSDSRLQIHASFADLAEHIASYFSDDAGHWRPTFVHTWDEVTEVRFLWAGNDPADFGGDLLEALKAVLTVPFKTTGAHAVAIAWSENGSAAAVVTFEERVEDGWPGIKYELRFRDSSESFPGWFAL